MNFKLINFYFHKKGKITMIGLFITEDVGCGHPLPDVPQGGQGLPERKHQVRQHACLACLSVFMLRLSIVFSANELVHYFTGFF